MERNLNIVCPKGHSVVKLCQKLACSQKSLICEEDDCEFSSNHKQCEPIQVIGLVKKLLKKERNLSDLPDPISQFYRQLIKKIQIDLEQYEKLKQETGFELSINQNKLLRYLIEGLADKVFPSLVNNVSKLLEKQSFSWKHDNQLKQQFKQEVQKMDELLNNVKQRWRKSNLSKINIDQVYRFDENLRDKQRAFIKQNGKCIQFKWRCHSLAMITPPVQNNTTIQFKVINFQYVYLCVFSHYIFNKKSFKDITSSKKGIIGVRYDGKMMCYHNPNQHKQSSTFNFKINDIVQIQCNFTYQKIIFTNITTHCPILQINFLQQEAPMYFGVRGGISQIQIIN